MTAAPHGLRGRHLHPHGVLNEPTNTVTGRIKSQVILAKM